VVYFYPTFFYLEWSTIAAYPSHLRIARSKNGIDFKIDKKPAIFPESKYERFGIEDPRITQINGRYYINYSAISNITGVTTCLTSTTDFVTFTRHGVIFMPDNKDVAIFPEKIKGRYYALNRPVSAEYRVRDMWISESPDLVYWGNHLKLMSAREKYWDEGRYWSVGVLTNLESEKSIEESTLLNSFTTILSVFRSIIATSSFFGLLLMGISATLIRSNISPLNLVTPQLKTPTTLKSGLDDFTSSGLIIGFFSDLIMFISYLLSPYRIIE